MTRVAGDSARERLRFRLQRFVGADLLDKPPFQRLDRSLAAADAAADVGIGAQLLIDLDVLPQRL